MTNKYDYIVDEIDKDKNDLAGQSLGDWQEMVYELAKSKGWYDNPDPKAHKEMACLAVAASMTLGVQTEAIRKGGLCNALVEILPGNGDDLTPEQHIKLARLWLIASEVFEAIESVVDGKDAQAPVYYTSKNGKPEGLGIELADGTIRLLDFCQAYGIPLENYMLVKHTYNESRPHRHGGKKV